MGFLIFGKSALSLECAAHARKLRFQYEGSIYHVMNRGDRREDIFRDEKGRKMFLATLHEACAKTDEHVHASCVGNSVKLRIALPLRRETTMTLQCKAIRSFTEFPTHDACTCSSV